MSLTQYTKINENKLWVNEIKRVFRQNQHVTNKEHTALLQMNALDMITYLDGVKMHKTYSDAYFSVSKLSGAEKLKRTAGVVGFELPKTYDAENPGVL